MFALVARTKLLLRLILILGPQLLLAGKQANFCCNAPEGNQLIAACDQPASSQALTGKAAKRQKRLPHTLYTRQRWADAERTRVWANQERQWCFA